MHLPFIELERFDYVWQVRLLKPASVAQWIEQQPPIPENGVKTADVTAKQILSARC